MINDVVVDHLTMLQCLTDVFFSLKRQPKKMKGQGAHIQKTPSFQK